MGPHRSTDKQTSGLAERSHTLKTQFDIVARLLKLSGMKYHGGKYTPAEWQEKTGVSPLEFPRLIHVSPRNRLCVWLSQAEAIAQGYTASVHQNFGALGVAC
jgi:hypothetical protein